jgi:transcriptional regulator with XRE-family HTH domain
MSGQLKFSNYLKKQREALRLTQHELAEAANLDITTISRLETGRHTGRIHKNTLVGLIHGLGLTPTSEEARILSELSGQSYPQIGKSQRIKILEGVLSTLDDLRQQVIMLLNEEKQSANPQ